MAKSLASLRRVFVDKPPLFTLYGKDGVGKTSFGGEWPSPCGIFMKGERPPKGTPITPLGDINTFNDVLDVIEALLRDQHDYQTFVVDSLDGMEPLIWKHVCEQNKWTNIEEAGYGKGYVFVDQPWRDFLDGSRALIDSGMAVVLIAHYAEVLFESPVSDPYKQYKLKLHKRAESLIREQSDVVAFISHRVSVKEKSVGFKTVSHGVGSGQRVIYLEERAGFIAKNRYQMPESVDYRPGKGYEAISKYFTQPTGMAPVQQAAE